MRTIGFIGLGAMGRGACRNLIKKADAEFIVFDINEKAAELFEDCAKIAQGVEEVFEKSDVIFMSLPNSSIIESIMETAFQKDVSGKTVIDLSTAYPFSTIALSEKLSAQGGAYIDAPLLGGPDDTENGTAPCVIAGDKEKVDAVIELVGCYAEPIDYVGKSGNAHLLKLAMNFTGLSYAAIEAQMFALMEKMNIDTAALFQIMNNNIFGNWVFDFYGKKFISKNYHLDFSLELALKDMTYVKKLYEEFNVPAFALDGVLTLLQTSLKEGKGKQDYSQIAATLYEYFQLPATCE